MERRSLSAMVEDLAKLLDTRDGSGRTRSIATEVSGGGALMATRNGV